MPSKTINKNSYNNELYYEEVNQLNKKIAEIINLNPEKDKIYQDIKEFFDVNFYSEKTNTNIQINNNQDNISLEWKEANYSLIIKFYGNGYWKYNLKKKIIEDEIECSGSGIIEKSFEGNAYEIKFENKEKSIYLFSLDDETEKTIKIEDHYKYSYEPIIKTSPYYDRLKSNVRILWSEAFYDGIISGYCYLEKELTYFDMEETSFQGSKRIYALYKLSLLEKLNARWRHFKFEHIVKKYKICFNLWSMKVNIMQKIENKILKKKTKEYYEKKKEEINRKKLPDLKGYFEL